MCVLVCAVCIVVGYRSLQLKERLVRIRFTNEFGGDNKSTNGQTTEDGITLLSMAEMAMANAEKFGNLM